MGTEPEVSGEEGVAAVKMATEIVNSLRSHDFKITL